MNGPLWNLNDGTGKYHIQDDPVRGPDVAIGEEVIVEQPGRPPFIGRVDGWTRSDPDGVAVIKVYSRNAAPPPDLTADAYIYGGYVRVPVQYVYRAIPVFIQSELKRLHDELVRVAEGERRAIEAAREVAEYYGVDTAPVTEEDGMYYEMCVRVRGIIAAYHERRRLLVDVMQNTPADPDRADLK